MADDGALLILEHGHLVPLGAAVALGGVAFVVELPVAAEHALGGEQAHGPTAGQEKSVDQGALEVRHHGAGLGPSPALSAGRTGNGNG